MSIYQRYLSKSLIFFSMFCVIFLLFIESNIGFKWIFNLTSCIFTRIKSEEISGNWRDFTLKNIKYNTSSFSIHANSIHVILDTKSLFKKSTIFKTLEIKNLVIMCKSNFSGHNQKNNLLHKFIKNNTFIKYPVIFQKVYINKVFFKTPTLNTYFAHVSTGVKLIKNNIVITPTHMNSIHIESSYLNIAKKMFNIIDQLY